MRDSTVDSERSVEHRRQDDAGDHHDNNRRDDHAPMQHGRSPRPHGRGRWKRPMRFSGGVRTKS